MIPVYFSISDIVRKGETFSIKEEAWMAPGKVDKEEKGQEKSQDKEQGRK